MRLIHLCLIALLVLNLITQNKRLERVERALLAPPAASSMSAKPEAPVFSAQAVQFVMPADASEPAEPDDTPAVILPQATPKPRAGLGNFPTPNTDQLVRKLQAAAANADGATAQQRILKQGNALIQQVEKLTLEIQIDMQIMDFLELKATEEGIDGYVKFMEAQKRAGENVTKLRQAQRDFDALIQPVAQPVSLPRLVAAPIARAADESRYSHVNIEKPITITQRGHFIIVLHFFYSDTTTEPPSITQVTDNFDLTAMQSVSGAYTYPAEFTAQIYELTRKMWRWQAFEWNRNPSAQELQQFLTVIN